MFWRWLLPALWALSAEADFFQLDSISNVSTYYFNYFYCNIWEGDCQPNQDDATEQGKSLDGMKAMCLNGLNVTEAVGKRSFEWCVFHWCPFVMVTVPTRDLWAGFPQDYISLLHQWYCSLGQCCESGDCRISNNITGIRSLNTQQDLCTDNCVKSPTLLFALEIESIYRMCSQTWRLLHVYFSSEIYF